MAPDFSTPYEALSEEDRLQVVADAIELPLDRAIERLTLLTEKAQARLSKCAAEVTAVVDRWKEGQEPKEVEILTPLEQAHSDLLRYRQTLLNLDRGRIPWNQETYSSAQRQVQDLEAEIERLEAEAKNTDAETPDDE